MSRFKEDFLSKFSGNILYMHGTLWSDRFEVSLENAKVFIDEFGFDMSRFCPLSLCFAIVFSLILWLPPLSLRRDL